MVALVFLGIWAAGLVEPVIGEDDGRIVIDEVVGQLIALAPLPLLGVESSALLLVTAFVAFRVFDVWKPGPVGQMEVRLRGGAAVVMDDVLAGLFTALLVAALCLLGVA